MSGQVAIAVAQTAAHGVVQGTATRLQGGSFTRGFIVGAAGATGNIVAGQIPGTDPSAVAVRVAVSAVAGGATAKLGGGKFANGAMTAAFVQIWANFAGQGKLEEAEVVDNAETTDQQEDLLQHVSGRGSKVPPDPRLGRELQKRLLLSNPKLHDHHLLPQEFRKFFAERGINIDDYTVTLTEQFHLRGVHGRGAPYDNLGKYSAEWKLWINRNGKNAELVDIWRKLGKMMDDYGLNNYVIHPYGQHNYIRN